MSTRCLIGKENKDKSIDYIYVHHDGYPAWAGRLLLQNYQDEEKIDKLLNLGDMSCLGKQPIASESFECCSDDFCAPYSLRGEDSPKSKARDEKAFLKVDMGQYYSYLFRNGKWEVAMVGGSFDELRKSFCGIPENVE